MKILQSLLIFLSVSPALAQQGVIPDSLELNALKKLYQATNGDQWLDNTGWLTTGDFTSWYGVQVLNGDVVGLNLAFNDLDGEIPLELFDLTELQDLTLEFNLLRGEIDGSINKLKKLRFLYLRQNYLTGIIPAGLGSLKELRVLDLFNNNLDGPIPSSLGGLSALVELDLAFNSFSGSIPGDLGNLLNLQILNLGDNLLDGEIPGTLGNLVQLFDLLLDYNSLSGQIPPSFSNLSSLEYFGVSYNKLSGNLPDFLSTLPIRGFWVYGNDFNSLPSFEGHPDLSSVILDVRENKLDFGDLEPIWTSSGSIFSFPYYFPQDSIDTFFNPSDFTFSVEVGGQYNQYQWIKNGIDIPGAISATFTLDQSEYSEVDVYQCRVTNTLVTGLTLWSESKPIRAGKYFAIADGNWNDPIWSREKNGPLTDGLPGEGSEVYIIGKDVTLSQNTTTGPVRVIVENAGASLTVDGVEMTVYGELELTKETEGYPGNVRVINGGKIIPR